MVDSTVRDLFASLENTLRERFRLIEDVLRYRSSSDMQLEEVQTSSVQLDSVVQDEVRSLREELASMRGFFHTKLSKLEGELNGLRTELRGLTTPINPGEKAKVPSPLICTPTLSGIEIIPKKEVVVHMNTQHSERPLEVTKVASASASASSKVVKKEELMEVEEEEVEEVEEEEVEEEEVEEEEVVEEVEEEEVEEEEEEEEADAGVELEEFEYKGATYYRDTENKVFMLDEDGSVGEPIGLWNVIKQKITRLPS